MLIFGWRCSTPLKHIFLYIKPYLSVFFGPAFSGTSSLDEKCLALKLAAKIKKKKILTLQQKPQIIRNKHYLHNL